MSAGGQAAWWALGCVLGENLCRTRTLAAVTTTILPVDLHLTFGDRSQGLKIPDTLPELQPGGGGDGDATTSSSNGVSPVTQGKAKNKPQWRFVPAGSARTEDGGAVAAVNMKQDGQGEGEGGGGAGGVGAAGPKAKTVVLHHSLCLEHHSCPPIKRSGGDPPPENVKRLEVIYNKVRGGVGIFCVRRACERAMMCVVWRNGNNLSLL